MFEVPYGDLHGLAESRLRRGGNTLRASPTTLRHEAYLGMQGRDGLRFLDRAHFLAYAVRAMRGLVISYVRAARAEKRGGGA